MRDHTGSGERYRLRREIHPTGSGEPLVITDNTATDMT